jgi:hypothetical protein
MNETQCRHLPSVDRSDLHLVRVIVIDEWCIAWLGCVGCVLTIPDLMLVGCVFMFWDTSMIVMIRCYLKVMTRLGCRKKVD